MTDADTARRAFLDALCFDEGDMPARREGISPYLILCGGGSFEGLPELPGYYGFPDWPGLAGPWGVSHAAGRAQFEPRTWLGQAVKLGLTDFRDPAQQDQAAFDLAVTVYRLQIGRALVSDLLAGRLDQIGDALHATWTSVRSTTFPARYRRALSAQQVPAEPSAAPALPTITALVEELQRRLAAAGFYDGAIDGLCGPLTSDAALRAVRS